jgi:hypothetical protein
LAREAITRWFVERRLSGDDSYYGFLEVRRMVREQGLSCSSLDIVTHLFRLESFKVLEMKIDGSPVNAIRKWRANNYNNQLMPKYSKQKARDICIAKEYTNTNKAKTSQVQTAELEKNG